jgi:hypothetical protein
VRWFVAKDAKAPFGLDVPGEVTPEIPLLRSVKTARLVSHRRPTTAIKLEHVDSATGL